MATPVAQVLLVTAILVLPAAHTQQPPIHVYSGVTKTNGNAALNSTTVSARIDGTEIAKTTVQGGPYSLSVQQTPIQSYTGKLVIYSE